MTITYKVSMIRQCGMEVWVVIVRNGDQYLGRHTVMSEQGARDYINRIRNGSIKLAA